MLRAEGIATNIAFATEAHGLPAKRVWDTITPQDGPFYIHANSYNSNHGSQDDQAWHQQQDTYTRSNYGFGDWAASVTNWCHHQQAKSARTGVWFIAPIVAADERTALLTLSRTPGLQLLLRFTHDLVLAKHTELWSRETPTGPIGPCPSYGGERHGSPKDIVCLWIVTQKVVTPCKPQLWQAPAQAGTKPLLYSDNTNELSASDLSTVFLLQFPKELASTTAQACQLLNGNCSDCTTHKLPQCAHLIIQPEEISPLETQPLQALLYTTIQRTTRLTMSKVQDRVWQLSEQGDTLLALDLQELCDIGDTESLTSSTCARITIGPYPRFFALTTDHPIYVIRQSCSTRATLRIKTFLDIIADIIALQLERDIQQYCAMGTQRELYVSIPEDRIHEVSARMFNHRKYKFRRAETQETVRWNPDAVATNTHHVRQKLLHRLAINETTVICSAQLLQSQVMVVAQLFGPVEHVAPVARASTGLTQRSLYIVTYSDPASTNFSHRMAPVLPNGVALEFESAYTLTDVTHYINSCRALAPEMQAQLGNCEEPERTLRERILLANIFCPAPTPTIPTAITSTNTANTFTPGPPTLRPMGTCLPLTAANLALVEAQAATTTV